MTGLTSKLLGLWCLIAFFPGSNSQMSWMTDGLVPWTFTCPVNTSFKKIAKSVYNFLPNNLSDQQWNFTCSNLPTDTVTVLSNCEWSGYANSYTSYINYQCPNDDVMTGMRTTYDSSFQDRMFEFQCCAPVGYATYSCFYTEYLNSYHYPVYYRIPDGYVLRGLHSPFSTTARDRRLSFLLCKLGKLAVVVG